MRSSLKLDKDERRLSVLKKKRTNDYTSRQLINKYHSPPIIVEGKPKVLYWSDPKQGRREGGGGKR